MLKLFRFGRSAEMRGKLAALDLSQAVIEFNLDGTIVGANDNFLKTVGYALPEIVGKHHSMFVEPAYRDGTAYKQFWEALRRGEFQAAQFKRVGKNGKEVWIEASYNPIKNRRGKTIRIVKYATDISAQKLDYANLLGQVKAIGKSQAVIEFDLTGTIADANENFLSTVGYTLAEVKGQHHGMFVEPTQRDGAAYKQFWEALRRGEYQSGQFKRVGKNGKEIWLEASYNPILDLNGRPFKIVKYATDVTAQKTEFADLSGQVTAIGKSQAVIEFALDGTILDANDNFLSAVGYSLAEVKGKHHGMFVEPAYRNSTDYRQFWDALRRGEYQAAQFKRFGKNGKEIWIEASYNPILDLNGKPFKVVKFATDISKQISLLADLRVIIDRNFGEIDVALKLLDRQADSARRATTETTASVRTVASAANELSSSIQGISERMAQSRAASETAHRSTDQAGQATKRLVDSTKAMSGIVELIEGIARQINLLALNAAVEAARAGDVGKGFAVVASEVKNLANQAGSATAQISTEIHGMQSVSTEVVSALGDITSSIETVRDYVSATAAAVDRQTTVTKEMSANMISASGAIGAIGDSIQDISVAVEQTNRAITQTREAAKVLAR